MAQRMDAGAMVAQEAAVATVVNELAFDEWRPRRVKLQVLVDAINEATGQTGWPEQLNRRCSVCHKRLYLSETVMGNPDGANEWGAHYDLMHTYCAR